VTGVLGCDRGRKNGIRCSDIVKAPAIRRSRRESDSKAQEATCPLADAQSMWLEGTTLSTTLRPSQVRYDLYRHPTSSTLEVRGGER